MLLDGFLPAYHFRERHRISVTAPCDVVRRAVEEWRPESSLFWRVLLTLRGMGAPHGSIREWAHSEGFVLLSEQDDEVVYGLIGRFWRLRERDALVTALTPDAFRAFDDDSQAVAAMNICTESVSPFETLLATETRIHVPGAGARRRFRLYWLIVRPFSGLLRRAMLRGIRQTAEASWRASLRERAASDSLDGTP